MKILVDSDGCPVRQIAEKVAKELQIKIIFVTDYNHVINSEYGEVITVSQSNDRADFEIVKLVVKDDLVLTNDYGVAVLALSKNAKCISFDGLIYTNENIDSLLLRRHIGKQIRKNGKYTKGPKKRTKEDDLKFENTLRLILNS